MNMANIILAKPREKTGICMFCKKRIPTDLMWVDFPECICRKCEAIRIHTALLKLERRNKKNDK